MSKEKETDQSGPDIETPAAETTESPEIVNSEGLSADLPEPSGESLADTIPAPEKPVKRGRGRPPGSTTKNKSRTAEKAGSSASAEMAMQGLDMLRDAVSNATCEEDRAHRARTLKIWEQYFEETGLQPPTWVLVLSASVSYVGPAFKTAPAKTKLEAGFEVLKAKIQSWKAKRAVGKS